MLYDFLQLKKETDIPLWKQLYMSLKEHIESGNLAAGEKLSSIREASAELEVSRTTVETAYAQLSMEGYIEAKPQSGYRVRSTLPKRSLSAVPAVFQPEYDFTTGSIDPHAADLQNWRKLMRAVLADEKSVVSYGNPQGEHTLRQELSSYVFRARGVIAEPQDIFVGAGVGPLLQLLCPLFPQKPPVFMEYVGFSQAEQIFSDYGFPVHVPAAAAQSYQAPALPTEHAAIVAELPSLRPRGSSAAISAHRAALFSWAADAEERYVLEDDYNGELHYRTRTPPAFQGICPQKTIYLGSFSKLLLPSVRIAYMVLPPALAKKARTRLTTLNQTAGKTEQLALAEYIHQGFLEKHLRRLRRLYTRKSQILASALQTVFGNQICYTLHETSLSFSLSFSADYPAEKLAEAAHQAGVSCLLVPAKKQPQIFLGFSGIPAEKIQDGIAVLGKVWLPLLR